jgi:hypothetical protein
MQVSASKLFLFLTTADGERTLAIRWRRLRYHRPYPPTRRAARAPVEIPPRLAAIPRCQSNKRGAPTMESSIQKLKMPVFVRARSHGLPGPNRIRCRRRCCRRDLPGWRDGGGCSCGPLDVQRVHRRWRRASKAPHSNTFCSPYLEIKSPCLE